MRLTEAFDRKKRGELRFIQIIWLKCLRDLVWIGDLFLENIEFVGKSKKT